MYNQSRVMRESKTLQLQKCTPEKIIYTLGPTGPTGLDGPTGDAGATGNVGPTGPDGPAGADGLAGADGIMGDTGATGATGDTGPDGDIGDTGDKGATGLTGSKGNTGLTGETGDIGDAGDIGAMGYCELEAGPTGDMGNTGDIGPTGATGDTGSKGETGEIGPTGYISGLTYPTTFAFQATGTGTQTYTGGDDIALIKLSDLDSDRSLQEPTGAWVFDTYGALTIPVSGLYTLGFKLQFDTLTTEIHCSISIRKESNSVVSTIGPGGSLIANNEAITCVTDCIEGDIISIIITYLATGESLDILLNNSSFYGYLHTPPNAVIDANTSVTVNSLETDVLLYDMLNSFTAGDGITIEQVEDKYLFTSDIVTGNGIKLTGGTGQYTFSYDDTTIPVTQLGRPVGFKVSSTIDNLYIGTSTLAMVMPFNIIDTSKYDFISPMPEPGETGAFDITNNKYVVQVPGYYRIGFRLGQSGNDYPASEPDHGPIQQINTYVRYGITVNGYSIITGGSRLALTEEVHAMMYLNVDDYVQVMLVTRIKADGNLFVSMNTSYFYGYLCDTPTSIVSATQTYLTNNMVGFKASISGSTSAISNGKITFNNINTSNGGIKDFDTHGGFNTSNGEYTVPITGLYVLGMRACVNSDIMTNADGSFAIGLFTIYVNGSIVAQSGAWVCTSESLADQIWLTKDDIIYVSVYNTKGTLQIINPDTQFYGYLIQTLSDSPQIGFRAYSNGPGDLLLSDNTIIPYTVVDYAIPSTNDYDTTLYTYKVPVSGMYALAYRIYILENVVFVQRQASIGIYVNDVPLSFTGSYAANSECINTVAQLTVGDLIYVKVKGVGSYIDGVYYDPNLRIVMSKHASCFYGHMIQAAGTVINEPETALSIRGSNDITVDTADYISTISYYDKVNAYSRYNKTITYFTNIKQLYIYWNLIDEILSSTRFSYEQPGATNSGGFICLKSGSYSCQYTMNLQAFNFFDTIYFKLTPELNGVYNLPNYASYGFIKSKSFDPDNQENYLSCTISSQFIVNFVVGENMNFKLECSKDDTIQYGDPMNGVAIGVGSTCTFTFIGL